MATKFEAIANKIVMGLFKFIGWLSLQWCLRAIKSKNTKNRFKAAEGMGILTDIPIHVPAQPLIEALQDEDARVRDRAALSLAWLGHAKIALPFLVNALKDEDKGVRKSAVYVLRTQAAAFENLTEMLNDEDSEVRKYAAEAIGVSGGARAIPFLIKALQDRSVQVRKYAGLMLGKVGDKSAIPALELAQKTDDARIWEGVKGKEDYQDVTMKDVAGSAIKRILEEW